MPRDIKHTWLLNHSPEIVWEYLTNSELLAQWLMKNDFAPVVGHKFMFTSNPRVKMGFDGKVYCEVLEVEPLKRLVYSWKGGPAPGKITLDSIVTWTLKPNDGGTALTIEHTGFKALQNFVGHLVMNEGWKNKIRKQLIKVLHENTANRPLSRP